MSVPPASPRSPETILWWQTWWPRGKITRRKPRNHPNKNIITRALGTERHTAGDLFEIDLNAWGNISCCAATG